MAFSSIPAAEALPKPANKVDSIQALGKLISSTGGALSETQIAAHGPQVSVWTGSAAEAHRTSATTLQHVVKSAADVHPSVQNALDTYAAELETALAQVTAAQEQWDSAILEHDRLVNAATDALGADQTAGSDASKQIDAADASASASQAQAMKSYQAALMTLGTAAGTATVAIMGAADSFVPTNQVTAATAAPGSTLSPVGALVGAALFKTDTGILGAKLEWSKAQTKAAEAAKFFNDKDLTEQEVKEFVEKYGDDFNNPFFANALATQVSPDQMIKILDQTDASWDGAKELNAGIGSLVVLATGGTDVSSEYYDLWESHKDSLSYTDKNGNAKTLTELQSDFAEKVKQAGNTVYINGQAYSSMEEARKHCNYWENPSYGYDWLGSAFAAAGGEAAGSTALVIGDGFLNGFGDGKTSIADDMVKWDHDRLQDPHNLHGADPGRFFGDNPRSGEPIYGLLTLMDGPTGEGLDQTAVNSVNDARIVSARDFMARDSLVEDESGNTLSTTEYLVGHRFVPAYDASDLGTSTHVGLQLWDYPDQGRVLGTVINDVTKDPNDPNSYTVTHDFIEGYCDGLAMHGNVGLLGGGESEFGHSNRELRAMTGEILSPYMDDITRQLDHKTGEEGAPGYVERNGQYDLVLSEELREQMIASKENGPGFFADLSYDAGSDSRDPALTTLAKANDYYMQRDLYNAMNGGMNDNSVNEIAQRYAAGYRVLERSAFEDDIQAGADHDKVTNAVNAVLKEGLSHVPFGSVIEDSKMDDYLFDKGVNGVEETILADGKDRDRAVVAQEESANHTTQLVTDRYHDIYRMWVNTQPDLIADAESTTSGSFIVDGQIIPYEEMTPTQRQDYNTWMDDKKMPNASDGSNTTADQGIKKKIEDMDKLMGNAHNN